MKKFNPFHVVAGSPWPFLTSLSFLSFMMSVLIMVRLYFLAPLFFSLLMLLFSSFLWSKDMHSESCLVGEHNLEVMEGLKLGMLIFILSECFFFFGLFWSYLHLAQAPDVTLGGVWPPTGVSTFDPLGVPFLNTILLISSGVSVTWAHHSLESGTYSESLISLFVTMLLGVTFSVFQLLEYYLASFTFSCSSFSSIYFLGTGFHGLHVLIGTLLLAISLLRFYKMHVSPFHSVGFECSVWYWHFVDVVWFFLYLVFYWWGI